MRFFWRSKVRPGAASAAALRETFIGLQRETQPDLFVEVGAYDAATSVQMRRSLPRSRIVAFEANPFNYKRFAKARGLKKGDVEFVLSAVADNSEQRTFTVLGDGKRANKRSSLLGRSGTGHSYVHVDVPCTSLDEFFRGSSHRHAALWIDVEGAAREVLTGAQRFLPTVQSLLIEVEEESVWQGQWLKRDVETLSSRGGLPANRSGL
ncbi:MAG: FkbM family methyltransferase [Bauldia sp.]